MVSDKVRLSPNAYESKLVCLCTTIISLREPLSRMGHVITPARAEVLPSSFGIWKGVFDDAYIKK